MITKNGLICGWGINDVNYKISVSVELPKVNGKRNRKIVWLCPYYLKWRNMLSRCFSHKYQKGQPTYIGCTICEEWKYLSNFIEWVDSQPNKDWRNCQPDKDFLCNGNRHYSPTTVVFIPKNINGFITDSGKSRGNYMIGVTYQPYNSNKNPYVAGCRNPFINKGGNIGRFQTELEAHKAWQAKKHEYACQLADLQEDPRVADALRQRYAPDKDWTKR